MSHRWRRYAPAVWLMGSLPPFGVDAVAQQPKPIVVDWINTEFIGPPPSLREMILAADAVVYGRIVAATPRDTASPVGGAYVRTAYRLDVKEMLHAFGGHPVDVDRLVILREGGDRDRGTHIARIVQADFPAFNVGDVYVIFLRWHTSDYAWTPAWGPNGAFRLSDGRVDSPGFAKHVAAQRGRAAAPFLEEIRRSGN